MSRRRRQIPPLDTRPRRATPFAYAVAVGAAAVLAACGPALNADDLDLLAGWNSPPAATALLASADAPHPAALLRVADNREVRQRAQFGEIVSIEPIVDSGSSSGTGAVVGGVLGAVLGNQVGSGSGRAAATALGGVGGAIAGDRVEKARSEHIVGYRIHVRLDNGGNRSFERERLDGLDVGERVRIDGARLRPA